jgi:hypothetical protein
LVGPTISQHLLGFDFPYFNTGVDTPAEAAIALLILIYVVAAWFNLHIPLTGVAMRPLREDPNKSLLANLLGLLPDFWQCSKRLWADKLGQISLSTTTLFWGLRAICAISCWPGGRCSGLQHHPGLGPGGGGGNRYGRRCGAGIHAHAPGQRHACDPLGVLMGLLVVCMIFIDNLWVAVPFLILLGGLGGFLVVPMNALLQHRGHNLMGAGRSIAVQNFNEQLAILAMGGFYSLSTKMGLTAFGAITVFGLLVAASMVLIGIWHWNNCRRHPAEVEKLLEVARRDCH